jgi:hypothetical protein
MELQPKDPSQAHFYISIVKSTVRIGAGIMLFKELFALAGILFVLAELLGIAEELF